MKKTFFLIGLTALITSATLAYSFEVTHYEVISGNTIKINNKSTYEISCIAAPYSDQPYFIESRDRLAKILSAGEINAESYIEKLSNSSGRLYVNGRNVCYEMLNGGFAWANSRLDRKKVDWGLEGGQDNYLQSERKARQDKVGLFAYENPEPPWQSKKMTYDAMAVAVPVGGSSSSESVPSYGDDVTDRCTKAIAVYKEKSEWFSSPNTKDKDFHIKLIERSTNLSPYKNIMEAECGTKESVKNITNDNIKKRNINNGTVNPHTGKYYPPAGSGVIDPTNGTYYTPSGSGFINTRTGQFMPK